jgi:hypothetical protein
MDSELKNIGNDTKTFNRYWQLRLKGIINNTISEYIKFPRKKWLFLPTMICII